MEMASSVSEDSKLPFVVSGRSYLVSPVQSQKWKNSSPKEVAANWALELRNRIRENVECHEDVNEDDIMSLKKELIAVFINTLQTDSRAQWCIFVETLALLEPFKDFFDYFETKAEFHHYLERVLHHVHVNKSRLFDLHVEATLIKIFPEHVKQIKAQGSTPTKNYSTPVVPVHAPISPVIKKQKESPSPRGHTYPSNLLPDGTNPYARCIPSDAKVLPAKQLSIRDLNKSMADVALEMAARESVWSHSLGTTALALATALSEEEKEKSLPEKSSFINLPQVPLSPRVEKTPRPAPKMQEEVPIMNGREAVQYFAGCHHMGQVKSLYLNLAPNKHYHPYDLISVPKALVNPEHYVFTTFGVLHVYPDQPSETLTLAEWQREAVLWKAISNIPFFKKYLITKAFFRWKTNKKFIDFQRRLKNLEMNLLSALPPFGAALLQISRLLKELTTVPLLPTEISKTYQLGEFENSINFKNIQAEKFLERFFKYTKMVIEFTVDESFKKLQYCEEQLKKKTFFTKDSLSLQRTKKEEREKNLANAKREAGFLGNFVKLVDQLIVEHMFEISKTQTICFIHEILVSGASRDGFFKGKLLFTNDGILTLYPAKERFQKVLSSALTAIPMLLASKAIFSSSNEETEETDSRNGDVKIQDKLSQTYSKLNSSITGSQSSRSDKSDKSSKAGSVCLSPEANLSLPTFHQQVLPTKEEDELGVATPDLVVMHTDDESIQVEGLGLLGQYNPLAKASLEEKLSLDTEYQMALDKQKNLMLSALADIDTYCKSNDWLNEIQQFCIKWTEKSTHEFKGAAAFTIEQKLTELRQWSDRVRNFDKNYMTENGLIFVDCMAVHEGLLPRLNEIYQELISFVAEQSKSLAQNLAEEMIIILKNLTDKTTDVLSFAAFAKNFSNYKKNTVQYQQRIEYIRSLYEVIRMSYRQLTPEEEKCEERVLTSWESFLIKIQEASDFVNTQTPLMLQQLETNFQNLKKEVTRLSDMATSGKFLDPSQHPGTILADMKLIREKFFSVELKLHEASQCREAILGEAYNLKFLGEMAGKMNLRQEVWKYTEVTQDAIKDWKQMSFKKINMKKVEEKVSEWQAATARLRPLLPPGDPVLLAWIQQIEDFSKQLPVLSQLSEGALQDRHWQKIFLGMNVPYDPNHQLSVAELLSYNLSEMSHLVDATYTSALSENNQSQRLQQLVNFWQDRQFQLAKYLPDSMYKESLKRATSGTTRPSKLERYRQERAAAQAGPNKALDVSTDDFFVLIDVDELNYYLEDSRITVDTMYASPNGGTMKEQVSFWYHALRQIKEITGLWLDCQKKWLYLVKIFEQPDIYQNLSQHAAKFEAIHSKFKDWMRVVCADSKCLSVVNRRRGEKGYRLLQGDHLKSLFISLMQEQEEILKDLAVYVEKARTTFHRLYFLSDEEIVEMLGVSRNPQALLPYVRRCFPQVENMKFSLPSSAGGVKTPLDLTLNSDKLEVVSVFGAFDEELPLYTKVEPASTAPKWLHSVNQVLKNTMTIILKACVQARIEEGTRQPILILEELARIGKSVPFSKQEEINQEIKSTFRHWLLRFPVQCVLTTEAVIWERSTGKTLEKKDKEELRHQRSNLCSKLDQLVEVLCEVKGHASLANNDKHRLYLLLTSLLTQGIYHRDITDSLLVTNQVTDTAYDWLKILKFRMEIRNVLRAKTVVTNNAPNVTINAPNVKINAASKSDERVNMTRRVRDFRGQLAAEELPRTQTTVSTDYQFSPCYVQQLSHVFSYDYEYQGPSSPLVVTPLTERAFLALGQALKSFHCGTLVGPHGSGKTETLKELSKLLARCMFTISCHESTTLPLMLQYMSGLIQSGCFVLFDDTDRLTRGLLSVSSQQLDYVRSAIRTLDMSSENQYQIRGHSHYDKVFAMKSGAGVIRRNSLTTLHPLPKAENETKSSIERQKTVPHGFNEKGLVTYFEDSWVAERDQRRHSIEREMKIKESDLYKSNKPPPLFYEHVKANRRRSQPDFSKLNADPAYVHRMLGNIMFNGRLIQASSNFGCFMTLNTTNPETQDIPYSFKLLMRPCAMIAPDTQHIAQVFLQSNGFHQSTFWAKKITMLFKQLYSEIWRPQGSTYLHQMKQVLAVAAAKRFIIQQQMTSKSDETKPSQQDTEVAEPEERSLVFAIKEIIFPCFQDEAEKNLFKDLLYQIFPHTAAFVDQKNLYSTNIHCAIQEVLKENHLEVNPLFLSKMSELLTAVCSPHPVILVGQSGCGKTKLYQTLARAINMLTYKQFPAGQPKDDLTTESDLLCPVFKHPKVDVLHLFPGAMTPTELLGSFDEGIWSGGLIAKVLRDSYSLWLSTSLMSQTNDKKTTKTLGEQIHGLKRWLVLDGDLDPAWTEGIKTLMDDDKFLSLPSGERVALKEATSIVFETTDLASISPSLISRCSVLCLGPATTTWTSIYRHWKQNACNQWLLTTEGLQLLDDLVHDVFPPTVKFVTQNCQSALTADIGREATNQIAAGVAEISGFLQIFSALLDRSLNREVMEKKHRQGIDQDNRGDKDRPMGSRLANTSQIEAVVPNYLEFLKNLFVFSFIWGFGGHLHDRFKDNFGQFVSNVLYRSTHSIHLPLGCDIFDLYVDEKSSTFLKWTDKQPQDRIKNLAGFYVTPEVERYAYLLELLMAAHQPVLLTGAPGVGKTSLVRSLVLSKMASTMVTMSPSITSSIVLDLVTSHISTIQNKSNVQVPGSKPTGAHDQLRHLFFIDDLNMAPAVGGYQPPLELMRCILTTGALYDKRHVEFQTSKEATFIAAATQPSAPGTGLGKACHVMSSRLSRQFLTLTMFTPSEDGLVTLFSRPLYTWLEEFPTYSVEHPHEFSKAMGRAALELYKCVKEKLQPSPTQPHYIFTLHDLTKVLQGIMLMSPRTPLKKTKTKKKEKGKQGWASAPMMQVIARLWCHEVCRVFGDRIINTEDQSWFSQLLEDKVVKHFCTQRESVSDEIVSGEQKHKTTTPTQELEQGLVSRPEERDDGKPTDFRRDIIQPLFDEKPTEDSPNALIRETNMAATTTKLADANVICVETREDNSNVLSPTDITSEESDSSDSESAGSSPTCTSPSESVQASPHITDAAAVVAPDNTTNAKDEHYLKKSQNSSTRRAVTFKAGLIADAKQEVYNGALLSFNEIIGQSSNLTNFMFSKFYTACHAEANGVQAEKGYMETGEESLAEALRSCLNKYNKGTSQRIDLVFFSEAIHHAAKLSRVLSQPRGHALLLGMSYCTGRATLTRLAAYVSHCKLFEPKPQSLPTHNLQVLKRHIRLSCHHAGINGKPAVLLVHEDLGDECLYDVAAVMGEGSFLGFYSEADVQEIVGHILPGGLQTKKLDQIEQAFDRYMKRIRQNLHVVICLNYKGNSFSNKSYSLHEKLQLHPGLIKNCFSLDLYQPWSFTSLATVAKTWLEDTKSGVVIPWNPQHRCKQIDTAANAMAYIHLSAQVSVARQFCHQREPLRIFTPLTFMEFVHLFKIVVAYLVKTEKAKGKKYEQALGKIDEAFGSIAEFKKEVSNLVPQQKNANSKIVDLVSQVETYKQDYIQALEQCKVQEETINQLQEPLEKLRSSAQTEFDKVNPVYQAAAKVLDNLDVSAVEELRSYPSPPEGVKFVMKAVCLLFNKPQTWESAKSMMVDTNFFENLIFYDKDNIPEDMYKDLKDFVNKDEFMPEFVAQSSSAAASICAWVRAVFNYSTIQRKMKPHLKSLQDAEHKFSKAQAQLGQLRIEANKKKTNLEQFISQHKEAMKMSKAIEKQIQVVEKRIVRANNLMENMSMQHFLWRSELKKTRKHVASAPGDALITAACAAYHGPLDDKSRLDLIQDWLNHIKQNTLDAQAFQSREPYSMTADLELLMDQSLHRSDCSETTSFSHGGGTCHSEQSSSCPQVKTFKYVSAVYDSSKYYKSDLRKQDTMESVVAEQDMLEDSDDEDEHTILPTRPNFTLQEILSDFDELSEWRMSNLPTDLHSIQNALMMRLCCHNRKHCWPLLIDPDNHAEMWVRALHKNQNIFTQKDVADFPVEDEIPIEEENESRNEETNLDPPPSRGTMLTFSDMTEYTIPESNQWSTPRTSASRGGASLRTGDSDELRPVTSVTNSWDTYSLHPDSELDTTQASLWVLEADDPSINSRLINALVHGVPVLVTHLERKPLDPFFRGLLLKQFYVDKDGNKIVKVGDMAFNFHPSFCLYLSTTVPLFVKGDGLYSIPLNRVCVINMAVSDEAIINHLMSETMKVEKKEFEGQRRSNENDIILHRQRLAREHEIIREKTLNLTGPLLEDKTMLDSLLVCQTNVEHNRQILQETRFMGDHLQGKFSHYSPFIRHSAMLYNVLHKMSALYPCYYLPFYKFVQMFADVIKSRDRGKGSLGTPQARAQELSDAVLHAVLKYVKLMMFEQHYSLLLLLISLERMLRQHKASNKELSLFVNGFVKQGLDDSSLAEQKPEWMDATAWIDCSILESLHHQFQGLCHSLVNSSQQWKEYFHHQISLVNTVPGTTLQDLSFFQKCLLWKFVCPQKILELSNQIVLYELGSAVEAASNYDIREVYTYTNQHTPTIFLFPSSGQHVDGTNGIPYISPAHEIQRLAREVGMEGKVCILNFGADSQLPEISRALEDSMAAGHWLLLQNYHLASRIDQHFFNLLKDIIYSRWVEDDTADKGDQPAEGKQLVARSQTVSQSFSSKIHNSFRLWITSQADHEMPGLLIQHGLRVTCEVTANFHNLLAKSYKSAAFLLTRTMSADNMGQEQRFKSVMPLALLHAILVQQSYFGRQAFVTHKLWTLNDLVTAVDILQSLNSWTSDKLALAEMIGQVYTRHCEDRSEAQCVEAVANCLALSAILGETQKEIHHNKGFELLLHKLTENYMETNDIMKTLDSIEDTSARCFCLPEEVEEAHYRSKSRIFLKEFVQATGAPELLMSDPPRVSSVSVTSAVLQTISNSLSLCPDLPKTSTAQILPLDAFFSQEAECYRKLKSFVESDLNILQGAVNNGTSLTANMASVLDDICNDRIPSSWLHMTYVTCSSLKQWMSELPTKMAYINSCLRQPPAILALPMFLRPDKLFTVVMQMFARNNFQDIVHIALEFQVMPDDFNATVKAEQGVYITGLQLKNASWDSKHHLLIDPSSCTSSCQPFPTLCLKPSSSPNQPQQADVYQCPLYSSQQPDLHSDSTRLYTIPLPINQPPHLLALRRTLLTLSSIDQLTAESGM